MTDLNKPVIVLVRPQLGENIGKAARAMLNFGLTEMRLVSPRDGWPNPSAGPAASGADIVLEQAKVYATTAEAVADCQHVHATTVRKRGVTKPVIGADGEQAGTVVDLWVDRMEMMFRFAEVQLAGSDKRVLLPMTFARIKKDGTHVQAILGHQFVNVPQTKSNEQITLLEEEKITAYYGAGTLYATPERQEPII